MAENMLIVEPQDDLRYTGPVVVIELTNPTTQTCYYVIKNTAPEGCIFISPCNGILQAKESSEFAVKLNQIPCSFNIIIQSVMNDEENTDINVLFAELYADDSTGLKLKYSFMLSPVNSVIGEISVENDGELIIVQQYNGKMKTATKEQPVSAEPSAVSSGTSLMKFTNTTNQKIKFKIKPKASSKYISQPMIGTIEPKQMTEFSIQLQPRKFNSLGFNAVKNDLNSISLQFFEQKEELNVCIQPDEQNLGEKNIHKFEIKSVAVGSDTNSNNEKITATIPSKTYLKELDEYKEQMSNMLQELAKLIQENVNLKAQLEKFTAEKELADKKIDKPFPVGEKVQNPVDTSRTVCDDSISSLKMSKE